MVRDDDYIRALLMEAEACDAPHIMAVAALAPDPDDLKRRVHAEWLCDAGFFAPVGKHTFRITNQGHDYLAAIRDEGVWTRAKAAATGVGGVTLSIMKDIAVAIVKQEASKHLGLPL